MPRQGKALPLAVTAMGLDIYVSTDNDKDVYSIDFYRNENELRKKMRLSREFCNLMCRKDSSNGTPEFTQIARITGVSINPILDMDKYIDDEGTDLLIPLEASEEDRSKMLSKIQADRERLRNNIDIVYKCVADQLDKLSSISDLNNKLVVSEFDTIRIDYYFTDFDIDKGDGYIGNNFGQDLRNFRRFLEYAKSKGVTTVYFNYG